MAGIGVKVRQSGSIMSLKRCRDAAELRKSFEFVEFLSFFWEERALSLVFLVCLEFRLIDELR
jgi:hypothetical protein